MKLYFTIIQLVVSLILIGCNRSVQNANQENISDTNVSVDNSEKCNLLESELKQDMTIKDDDRRLLNEPITNGILSKYGIVIKNDVFVIDSAFVNDSVFVIERISVKDRVSLKDSVFCYVPWIFSSNFISREIEFPATANKSLNDSIIKGLSGLLPLSDTSVYIQNLKKEVTDCFNWFCEMMNEEPNKQHSFISEDFEIDDGQTYRHCFVNDKVLTYECSWSHYQAGMLHIEHGAKFISYRLIDGRKLDKSMILISDKMRTVYLRHGDFDINMEDPDTWSKPFFNEDGLCFSINEFESMLGNYVYIPWSKVSQFLTEEGRTFVPDTFLSQEDIAGVDGN